MSLNTLLSTKNIKLITVSVCFFIIIVLQNIIPLARIWIISSIFTGLSIHGYILLQRRLELLPYYGLVIIPIIILIMLNIDVTQHRLILSIQAISFMALGLTLVSTFSSRHPRHH